MSMLKSLATLFVTALVCSSVGWASSMGPTATNQDLPELGSAAQAAVSIEEEYQAGLSYVNEIRKTGVIITDPEISQYAQEIGHSLSSQAQDGQQRFYYFVTREPIVN